MASKPKNKGGAPTKYTTALGDEIMVRMAEGETLTSICKDLSKRLGLTKNFYYTVLNWACDPAHEFFHKYNRGRDLQADTRADEIIEIADDARFDWQERATRDGGTMVVADHEHIARSKLRVEARKWAASKLKPKRYGEKVEVETKDVTPQLAQLPSAQLLGLLQVTAPVAVIQHEQRDNDDE